MKKASFGVEKNLCAECSLALKRFIGGLDGVESIDVEGGKVVVSYDENEIDQSRLETIARDSIRKLGYDVEE